MGHFQRPKVGHLKLTLTHEEAQIYQQLDESFNHVLDLDEFPRIHAPERHQKSIQLDGHMLTVTATHRARGVEDVFGVDVVYTIIGWKGLAFQHKKLGRQGKLVLRKKEREQRANIMQLCAHCSEGTDLARKGAYVKPLCSSVYVVGDDRSHARHVVSACQLDRYRKTFREGAKAISPEYPLLPDLDLIDRMFLACIVGTPIDTKQNKTKLRLVEDTMLARPDLLITAELSRIITPEVVAINPKSIKKK